MSKDVSELEGVADRMDKNLEGNAEQQQVQSRPKACSHCSASQQGTRLSN